MKTLGTLFAIFLTMSPVAIVNAQTSGNNNAALTSPTTVSPEIVTKSDLQRVQGKLSKQMSAAEARQAARTQQAEAQRKVDEEEASIRLSQQLARQAQAQRKAQSDERIYLFKAFGGVVGGILLIFATYLVVRRDRKTKDTTTVNTLKGFSTPEDLYGRHPSPGDVKKCLCDNNLDEGVFTIDLPADHLVFEYRACKMADGSIVAFFPKNERPVSLDHQKLRRVAKQLYDDGTGPLQPITLKPTGIRRVS